MVVLHKLENSAPLSATVSLDILENAAVPPALHLGCITHGIFQESRVFFFN